MSGEALQIRVDGVRLAAERWVADGPAMVLLHAGVCDRRSWHEVVDRLEGMGTVLAYDSRGYGESPVGERLHREVDDLWAVLDQGLYGRPGVGSGAPPQRGAPVWLVGSSMGGRVALDAALEHPERIAGLVLLAPAVSGAPAAVLDPATQRLSDALDAAGGAGDLEEVNRLETWLWLDGPGGPEGRVSGPARQLALEMNRIALEADTLQEAEPQEIGQPEQAAWERLEEVQVPVTVAWGDPDVPFLVERCEQMAARLPRARTQVITGTAHLPYLEDPDRVAGLLRAAVADH